MITPPHIKEQLATFLIDKIKRVEMNIVKLVFVQTGVK